MRRRRLRKLTPTGPSGPALLELGDLSELVMHLEVPLGAVELRMGELPELAVGSVLQLDRLTGESVDVTANGTPIARAEIRVHGENFAVRITEILGTPPLDPRETEARD
jgi:flagellar motor switch protein FliN